MSGVKAEAGGPIAPKYTVAPLHTSRAGFARRDDQQGFVESSLPLSPRFRLVALDFLSLLRYAPHRRATCQ